MPIDRVLIVLMELFLIYSHVNLERAVRYYSLGVFSPSPILKLDNIVIMENRRPSNRLQ